MQQDLRPPRPVADLMAYQNDKVVERYMTYSGGDHASAMRCFVGMKQFLAVCNSTPGMKVTSEPIDQMWHTFLLFTRDYASFCTTYLGRFLHHEPFEIPRPDLYVATRAQATVMFGELDPALWPPEAKGDCSSGGGWD